ncbi:MAG: hypothetical protein KFH98_16660, partial [Gemmatimonadetes bacterium]|nr:hypothetical protein [Gemmatimonadota bacterium]
FLILRAAARMEADHASGSLSPVMAAGGWRWTYGAASCLAALLAPSLILATAAAALAIAVVALTGSTELIRLLPSTVGGGVLVLATVSVCTVAAGCVLRRTAVTVVVVATVMLMPVFLLMRHALSEASPPAWTLATPLVSPLMVPPADTLNVVRAVVYVLVVGLLAALASHRYAARTP